MGTLKRVELCDLCRADGGWLLTEVMVDVDGRQVPDVHMVRCDHGRGDELPESTPEEARDASLAAMADDPHLSTAVEIIRLAAVRNPTVSANTVRVDMDAANIPKPMRGLAFRSAVAKGYIRSAGFEPSTDLGTHAHSIRLYESLRFTGGAW